MAGNIKDLIVKILVDDGEVEKFQKAGEKGLKFGDVLNKGAIASAAALGGLAAGAIVAGNAASDLEQSAGGVDAVFGKFAGSMHRNANAAADAVGLSANSYNEFATVIGSQLKNAGVPMDKLGGKTKDLIGKAADLAATFGGPTSDAVEAISAAMKGEMDPIEKYGISLNQASLQQQAATMGVKGNMQSWDTATKQSVILAAITKQGGDAWGQFGKQSDTAAEKQQTMQANLQNTSAKLGSVLLPVMGAAADMLAKFGKWAGKNATLVQILAGVLAGLAGGVLLLSGVMKTFAAVEALQTAMQEGNNLAWLSSPITWIVLAIIAAIALLVAAGVWLYQNWDKVTKFIGDAWNWVYNTIIKPVADVIAGAIKVVGDIMTWLWVNAISPALNAIGGAFSFVWGIVKPIFDIWWATIQIVGAVIVWLWQNAVVPAMQGIGVIFTWLWNNVTLPFTNFIVSVFRDTVAPVFGWLWHTIIKPAFDGIGIIFNWIWNSVIKPVIDLITKGIHVMGDAVGTVMDAIGGTISDAFNGMVSIVKGTFNTVIDAVNSVIGGINTVGKTIGKALGISIHISKIPRLASGGIVTAPTFAQVGEAGPEAVIPLRSPAARNMLGGSDGPVKLDKDSMSELGRIVASAVRLQLRQGNVI